MKLFYCGPVTRTTTSTLNKYRDHMLNQKSYTRPLRRGFSIC